MRRRIGLHVVEYREFAAISDEACLGIFRQPRVAYTLVGDQQDTFCAVSRNQLGQLFRRACLEQNVGRRLEGERFHLTSLLIWWDGNAASAAASCSVTASIGCKPSTMLSSPRDR